jgi:phospholipid transport system substrate-binding protein
MLMAALTVLMLFLSLSSNWCLAEESSPRQVVQRLNQALLNAMKNSDDLGFQGRYALLGPVIKESFALEFMLRKSVGRYWSEMNQEEKIQLLELYTRWSVASYANRFDSYNGQQFQVKPQDTTHRWLTVDSIMQKSDGSTVQFRYVFFQFNGRWKILDIKVNGISQLAMTKSQMISVIKRKGLSGLIQRLENKIEDLSENKGTESPPSATEDLTPPSSIFE